MGGNVIEGTLSVMHMCSSNEVVSGAKRKKVAVRRVIKCVLTEAVWYHEDQLSSRL